MNIQEKYRFYLSSPKLSSLFGEKIHILKYFPSKTWFIFINNLIYSRLTNSSLHLYCRWQCSLSKCLNYINTSQNCCHDGHVKLSTDKTKSDWKASKSQSSEKKTGLKTEAQATMQWKKLTTNANSLSKYSCAPFITVFGEIHFFLDNRVMFLGF